MTPDDPRHGTTPGYHAGCRELCCRRAIARYEKGRRLTNLRGGRAVPALGIQRRIQALMCLGWTSTEIATEAGYAHRNYALRVLHGQKGKPANWLERKTADRFTAAYDVLSMRVPPAGSLRGRTIRHALRNGYAPPLAWDCIDTDPAPNLGGIDDQIDPVVVDRLLHLEPVVSSRAEKVEAMRRWLASGRSEKAMCDALGWKSGRYVEREDGAA